MTTLDKTNMGVSPINSANVVKANVDSDNLKGRGRQDFATTGNVLPSSEVEKSLFEVKKQVLEEAVNNVSTYVQNITRELNFSVDEELGRFVVKVLDQQTGEEIRQIPTEDMLELARTLKQGQDEDARGILFQGDA